MARLRGHPHVCSTEPPDRPGTVTWTVGEFGERALPRPSAVPSGPGPGCLSSRRWTAAATPALAARSSSPPPVPSAGRGPRGAFPRPGLFHHPLPLLRHPFPKAGEGPAGPATEREGTPLRPKAQGLHPLRGGPQVLGDHDLHPQGPHQGAKGLRPRPGGPSPLPPAPPGEGPVPSPRTPRPPGACPSPAPRSRPPLAPGPGEGGGVSPSPAGSGQPGARSAGRGGPPGGGGGLPLLAGRDPGPRGGLPGPPSSGSGSRG